MQGRQVTRFDDHSLLRPSSHTSTVYINHAQDLIVSLCLVCSSRLFLAACHLAGLSNYHKLMDGLSALNSLSCACCRMQVLQVHDDVSVHQMWLLQQPPAGP